MISAEQKFGYDMALNKQAGEYALSGAKERAAAGGSMNTAELLKMKFDELKEAVARKDKQAAETIQWEIEQIKGYSTQTKEGQFGLPGTTTEKGAAPYPGMAPKTITVPKDALTHLLNNPGTAKEFEEYYGIQPGWAADYISKNRKGN